MKYAIHNQTVVDMPAPADNFAMNKFSIFHYAELLKSRIQILTYVLPLLTVTCLVTPADCNRS